MVYTYSNLTANIHMCSIKHELLIEDSVQQNKKREDCVQTVMVNSEVNATLHVGLTGSEDFRVTVTNCLKQHKQTKPL